MPPAIARRLRTVLARTFATALALLLALPELGRAQTACGTPGKDGPGGTLTGVVNTYWPGTGTAAAGTASITVSAAIAGGATTAITPGDLLLVIQVQDASINTTNTSAYGSGGTSGSGLTSTGTAGQYEYVVATSALSTMGGTVTVRGASNGNLLNSYASTSGTTAPRKRFQVVRVPQYSTATFGSGLTAAAWNGTAGGVLALDVAGQLTLGGTVSVDGLGFRGGGARQLNGDGTNAASTDYANSSTINVHGVKGEGVAGTPRYTAALGASSWGDEGADVYPGGGTARGAPGNAGGGGTDDDPPSNARNSGGGGGAGAGTGGTGGRSWNTALDVGGRGGSAFPTAGNRLTLGGGGGAGTTNDGTGSPGYGFASSGAPGGGVVLVRAGTIAGAGTISANGASANNTVTNDGSGGGGGGGSVLVYAASGGVGTLTVTARGGTGGTNTGGGVPHGPGGGGGGGYAALSAAASVDVSGGANGTTAPDPGYGAAFGATPGSPGVATAALSAAGIPGSSPSAGCVAQLTVTKTTSTASATAGTQASYTITITSLANRDSARQVTVVDTLPAGMKYAAGTVSTSAAARSPATGPAAGDSVVNFGTFAIAGSGSVTITFSVNVAYKAAPTTRQNSAVAVYLDPLRSTAGGTAAARYNGASSTGEDVTITGVPDLRLSKTHAGAFAVGKPGAYTITVSNAGTAVTSGTYTVTDTLPAGLTYASFAGTSWSCNASGQVVSCNSQAAVASGAAAAAITLNVGVTASAAASVTNTARVAGGAEPAALAADNAASDPTTVNRVDLGIAITDSSRAFVVGQAGAYVVTVQNAGTASASGTSTVSVTIPTGLTYASAAGTGWSCTSASAQAATCTRADTLAPAAAWPALRVQVSVAAAAAPSATTTVSITTANDVVASNNSASATTTVVSVGVTVSPNGGTTDRLPSRAGAVTYTQPYTVTNTGSASDAFTLTAALAPGTSAAVVSTNGRAGTSATVTLAASASATVNVVYTIADNAAAGATDSVRLTATSGTSSSTSARGYTVARVVRAGLQIAKQAYKDDGTTLVGASDRVLPGQYVRYKITVTSAGTANAVTVHVVDPIPPQLAFDSYTVDASGWTITTASATLTADLAGALAAGQSRYFWLRVRVQ